MPGSAATASGPGGRATPPTCRAPWPAGCLPVGGANGRISPEDLAAAGRLLEALAPWPASPAASPRSIS